MRAWYAWNHRRQWRQLLEAADCVPVGCSRWVETWQQRQPRFAHKLFTLASPSNLPLAPVPADHRSRWRLEHGLDPDATILAYFGTLDPSKQLPWILAAWTGAFTPKRPVVLVLIGATPTVSIEEKYRPYFRPLGHLPAEAASQALSAVDLLALPFIDGISERRGSLMGGLQHGVSVVSTTGHNTGAKLRQADWLTLTPVGDRSAFVRAVGQLLSHSTERARLGAAGQEQYLRAYSWPIILGQLRDRFPR